MAIGSTALDGALGPAWDRRGWQDAARVIGLEPTHDATADFPLSRDITSWFLLFVVISTCMLVHRQWQIMSDALPRLAGDGAVKPCPSKPGKNRLQQQEALNTEAPSPTGGVHRQKPVPFLARIFGLREIIEDNDPKDYLAKLVEKVHHSFLQPAGSVFGTFAVILVAILVVWIPVVGLELSGIFQALMPQDLNPDGQAEWLRIAYESWWAGFDLGEHLFGFGTYVILATFGVYVVLLQNIVGCACAYIVLALPVLTKLDADWLNRDGRYGWTPIARIFRTVYWSLALHGLTLSVLLIVFGLKNSILLIALIAIWVVVVPLYVFVPMAIFRRVEPAARKRRLAAIEKVMQANAVSTDSSPVALEPFRVVIEQTRNAKIRPLRMRGYDIAAFIGVLSPIIVTVMQIYFEGWLGTP